jgi:hypothetical protein
MTRAEDEGAPAPASTSGFSPLQRAALSGTTEQAAKLIESGADVKAKTPQGKTSLHLAAWSGDASLTQLLLDHGADPNACTNDGYSALHFVSLPFPGDRKTSEAMARVTELLIARGADPNKRAKDGRSPLHVAAQWDRESVATILLARSADANAVDVQGRAPSGVALGHGVDVSAEVGQRPFEVVPGDVERDGIGGGAAGFGGEFLVKRGLVCQLVHAVESSQSAPILQARRDRCHRQHRA